VYNLNYTPTTLRVKAEEQLHLGVREQKEFNTAALDHEAAVLGFTV
jgi:hypothetical protein